MTSILSSVLGTPRRPWRVPEVIQSSAMDCGPASLKSLLQGFGIEAGYGRLREACQTDVDGTSIDSLESLACDLGLRAEQIMVPLDHVLLESAAALPALIVVRLPNGNTHFVVLWRAFGPWVQLMDPGSGRLWQTRRRFLDRCYLHEHRVAAADWKQWASSKEFEEPLRERLQAVGLGDAASRELYGRAVADRDWKALAALDAACRSLQSMIEVGAVDRRRGPAVLDELWREACRDGVDAVPRAYWSAAPVDEEAEPEGEGEPEQLVLRGAVLVRVRGLRRAADGASAVDPETLPADVAAVLEDKEPSPWRALWDLVRESGRLLPVAVAGTSVLAALVVLLEALILRAFFDLGRWVPAGPSRWAAMGALVAFGLGLVALRAPVSAGVLRIGRHLEMRLRIRILEKLPRLPDRYMASRLVSDMVERSHAVHHVRSVPLVLERLLGNLTQAVATVIGILWLDPSVWPWALAAAGVALGLPLLIYGVLAERDLKARSHAGALAHFYRDGLLGLTAVRAHGAERTMRREHEKKLLEWRRAVESLVDASALGGGLQTLAGFLVAVGLLQAHLSQGSGGAEGSGVAGSGAALLLVYWTLRLPQAGQDIFADLRSLPSYRSTMLRLLEWLGASEDAVDEDPDAVDVLPLPSTGAVVQADGVRVVAGGQVVLDGLDLRLEPGEHVAVIGPSGAGKSTLLGLLLGRFTAAGGELRVDGEPLTGSRLQRLHRATAWVDPSVHLWNRSLLDNLRYGEEPGQAPSPAASSRVPSSGVPSSGVPSSGEAGSGEAGEEEKVEDQGEEVEPELTEVLDAADLSDVLERLPQGLGTGLGEAGGLVSGGEGQRVRLARAWARRGARLALLDEPFRGLDQGTRQRLMAAARKRWRRATMICVTHDVGETLSFDRVLVIENGRLVEDGDPAELKDRPESRLRFWLAQEAQARQAWRAADWRRLWVADGNVREGRAKEDRAKEDKAKEDRAKNRSRPEDADS